MDGADVCRTSRRPPDVISDLAILDPRWRGRKWRHPGPGAGFSTPIAARGAKWRPFRFRSPSWMTSFAGTGNEVIQDGDRKRKGRHFAPRAAMGVEKPALYYWHRSGSTLVHIMACCLTAPSHYLNQCWFIISKVPLHSSERIIISIFEDTNKENKNKMHF